MPTDRADVTILPLADIDDRHRLVGRTRLWRLHGLVEDVDCYSWRTVEGSIALAVQRAGEVLLYENHPNLAGALRRGSELRERLVDLGLVEDGDHSPASRGRPPGRPS